MNRNFNENPLNKIIGLSVILSMGFLLVILAAIYGNWFPIIIGIVFSVAYLPILIANAISNPSDYDYSFDAVSGATGDVIKELGLFISAFLVTTALGVPLILYHSKILTKAATVLTIAGGSLIFGTVFVFSRLLEDEVEEGDDLGGGVI